VTILYLFARRVLITVTALILLWVMGLGVFIFTVPENVADEETETQAVVVLTGGRKRLKTGFQLLCSKRAEMIFISGVHPQETLKSLLKSFEASGIVCSQDRDKIAAVTYLGYTAKNTKGNAQEIETWLKQMPVTSFRLVTAAYHMPRSLLEFNHLLPQATIIPHPVFPKGFNRSRWWQGGTLYLIVSEYNKFLLAFVRIHVPFASKAIVL